MSTYSTAVAAITAVREETIAALEAEYRRCRDAYVSALRADLRSAEDTPVAAIRNLVAETIIPLQDDGVPTAELPDDTRRVVRAAVEAGILEGNAGYVAVGPIQLYHESARVARDHPTHVACYLAYRAWQEFLADQKTRGL
jgi:hypothetical protein